MSINCSHEFCHDIVLVNELDTIIYTMMEITILLVSVSYHIIVSAIDVMVTLIGEKLFDNVEDVVADGLITLYMEKHNADNYLQRQRSSIISSSQLGTTQNGSVRPQKPLPQLPSGFIDNDLNKDTRCALTPIVEQEFNFDDNSQPGLPVVNGYSADPTMSIIPHNDFSGNGDLINSLEDSLVSESQVCYSVRVLIWCSCAYMVLCVIVGKTCYNNNGWVLSLDTQLSETVCIGYRHLVFQLQETTQFQGKHM